MNSDNGYACASSFDVQRLLVFLECHLWCSESFLLNQETIDKKGKHVDFNDQKHRCHSIVPIAGV